ncbi:MAG: hypothetical protein QM681_17445 [Novosphingobium sp.]
MQDYRYWGIAVLQIIGWLGCLYLVVKGFEISASSAMRDENGKARFGATTACMLAWGGAVVFGIWLADQGSSFPRQASSTPDPVSENIGVTPEELNLPVNDCTMKAKTDEEMRACNK